MSRFQWNTNEAMKSLSRSFVFGQKQMTELSNIILDVLSDRIEVGHGE